MLLSNTLIFCLLSDHLLVTTFGCQKLFPLAQGSFSSCFFNYLHLSFSQDIFESMSFRPCDIWTLIPGFTKWNRYNEIKKKLARMSSRSCGGSVREHVVVKCLQNGSYFICLKIEAKWISCGAIGEFLNLGQTDRWQA